MKIIRLILALCCAIPAFGQKEALQRAVGTNTVTGSLSSAPFQIATVAALKALTISSAATPDGTQCYVTGYYSAGDGGQGYFRYSAASSATDNGGTVIQPNAGTGRWLRVVLNGLLDVRYFGAKGDGSTDDTTAIQAAVTTLGTLTNFVPSYNVYFSPGNYKITAEISIPFSTNWKIYGASRGVSTITQFTNDRAIFTIAKNLTHSWEISNLSLTWNTQQTSSHTMSYGIRFDHDPAVGAAETSIFSFRVLWLNITKGYRGVGQSEAVSPGPVPNWNSTYDQITGGNLVKAMIFNVTPVSEGVPNVHVSNIYYAGWPGSATSQKEAPIVLWYCVDGFLNNLDIEGCADVVALDLFQCTMTLSGMHVENWTWSTGTTGLYTVNHTVINTVQTQLTVDGANFSVVFTTGGGVESSLLRGFQSYFSVKGLISSCTFSGMTNIFQFNGQATVYDLQQFMPGYQTSTFFSFEKPSTGNVYNYTYGQPKVNGAAIYGGITRYEYSTSGTTAAGSPIITAIASTANLKAGDEINGNGILTGSTIVSVDSVNQITISRNCLLSGVTTLNRTIVLPTTNTVYGSASFPNSGGVNGLAGMGIGASASEGAFTAWRNYGADRLGGAFRIAATGVVPTTVRFATSPQNTYGSEVWTDRFDIGITSNQFYNGATAGPKQAWGAGSPEGVVTAPIGSIYQRTDGGAATSFYVKESGTGNTGWVAK